jgi:hypothetical protein
MGIYIKSGSMISPQETYDKGEFPKQITEVISDRLTCVEPEYRNLINPLLLRRMPRILKMGLASAQLCINRSGGISPDGIIVGTGLGCLDNLEKFLMDVIDNQEHIKSVLPFINSTHNAVAAQISMLLSNQNYNVTYCHRGFSFESALTDAMMLINEGQAEHVLVGGIDECTSDFMLLHSYLKKWKNPVSNLHLSNSNTPGTIAGEGSAFFMLSSEPDEYHPVCIEGLHTFFTPSGTDLAGIWAETTGFLNGLNLSADDVDGVMTGINGDCRFDHVYTDFIEQFFKNKDAFYFKHLCGEYYTSVSFALWLGYVIAGQKEISPIIRLNKDTSKQLNRLLIYNQLKNTEHSLILINYGRL